MICSADSSDLDNPAVAQLCTPEKAAEESILLYLEQMGGS